ncbi:MAG: class I SAM-dependent methyltransferase [Sporichthyaceae bacterium]
MSVRTAARAVDVSAERGLSRSVALLRAFAVEQTAPEIFYGALAADSVRLVEDYTNLSGRKVLDVGAGPVQFAHAFAERGAFYIGVDADERAVGVSDMAGTTAIVAQGERLPLRPASVDVAFSSNVLEHVRRPSVLTDEMVRVTRPGGLIMISYTNWLSPWGGHETSPYHYLGGRRAIDRYARKYGRPPKNQVDTNLYRLSVAAGLRLARAQQGTDLLDARPRYYPRWARGLVRVPLVREFATWNLLLVLRRR